MAKGRTWRMRVSGRAAAEPLASNAASIHFLHNGRAAVSLHAFSRNGDGNTGVADR